MGRNGSGEASHIIPKPRQNPPDRRKNRGSIKHWGEGVNRNHWLGRPMDTSRQKRSSHFRNIFGWGKGARPEPKMGKNERKTKEKERTKEQIILNIEGRKGNKKGRGGRGGRNT